MFQAQKVREALFQRLALSHHMSLEAELDASGQHDFCERTGLWAMRYLHSKVSLNTPICFQGHVNKIPGPFTTLQLPGDGVSAPIILKKRWAYLQKLWGMGSEENQRHFATKVTFSGRVQVYYVGRSACVPGGFQHLFRSGGQYSWRAANVVNDEGEPLPPVIDRALAQAHAIIYCLAPPTVVFSWDTDLLERPFSEVFDPTRWFFRFAPHDIPPNPIYR